MITEPFSLGSVQTAMRIALALATAIGLGILVATTLIDSPAKTPAPLALEAVHFWKQVPVGRPPNVSFHLRNLSNRPATVQRSGRGYGLTVVLLDPAGQPVTEWRCGHSDEPRYPSPEDFETLHAGGASADVSRGFRVPAPRIPGRHVLKFSYERSAPEFPTTWERMTGAETPDAGQAGLMKDAWVGLLSGEIAFDVY